ncbi:MAG: 16S rRNA (cytosine(1402)-N(4))-methyltransferase RsmH [Planctomycetes bacterium]|nr:16S rRNA (cytosine(1402)-N(4))-methyltransferase RsmH [Planctomycetota bacterium]
MVAESQAALLLKPNARVVDATFGLGGHASAFLNILGQDGRLLGLDRDERALSLATTKFINEPRVQLCKARFSEIAEQVAAHAAFFGADALDAIFFDLGVSSLQLDDTERGFSFQRDAALDLRMSRDERVPSAADVVNTMDEEALANVIYQYGEEHASRRVARAIVEARQRARIARTLELAEIVKKAVPYSRADAGRIHPATRTFQALRIYVNGELDELNVGLDAALELLAPGGRLAVLSYHSLEDRIVKLKFRDAETRGFAILTKKPLVPGDSEIAENPRSRSARLRAIERPAVARPVSKNKYAHLAISRDDRGEELKS